jgi:phosphoglycerol transferase
LGGAYSYEGTTWTASGLISATSGVTVKIPVFTAAYGRIQGFMKGAYSLGQILEKNGYKQTILMGSDAEFANRDLYFKQHGNYEILDINALKKQGRLPKNYNEWWGFEDQKLFLFAKEELERLSKQDKPFNLTLLTADSHFPDGYVCENCEDKFENQYSNVLRCSSKQISEFVEWVKTQPYYENTTIIIVGDHLTMDPKFMKNVDKDYERTIYNCIINSAVEPQKEKERKFATFDLYPTTLASLGVTIEGDRLGLGTNLFSNEKTLTEKYGYEYSNRQIAGKSDYYNKEILKMK